MARLINFVSNLPQDLRSGGFSAMGAAAFAALSRSGLAHYSGPIDPPVIPWQKALSKLRRSAGVQGDFSFFSQQRLETIAREVAARSPAKARLDFFHGFTPWIMTKPRRPYVAWSDCTFRDYIDIFHRREQFRCEDLERIERAEAAWLTNARRVLFTSNWAAERAVSDYGVDPSRVGSVGIFGEVDMATSDAYAGGKEFAFVSTDFEAKGGRTVLAALRQVRNHHTDATLTIVGDPPSDAATAPGVTLAGFLRKEVPDEYSCFQQILSRARAVVHATRSDISPLLIIEAGYFGCPMISSRRFAIPELVDDGRTGLLLEDSSQANAVASAMNWMLDHEDAYRHMRKAAWHKAHEQHSKRRFEERLLSCVRDV